MEHSRLPGRLPRQKPCQCAAQKRLSQPGWAPAVTQGISSLSVMVTICSVTQQNT